MVRDDHTSHDQLFQELLERFLPDFLELVIPHLTGRLDLDRMVFIREKGFTASPRGRLLIRDLVARVPTRRRPPRHLSIHVEAQRDFRQAMGPRMRRYHHQQSAHRPQEPVLSIVLFLTGGPGGVRKESVEERVWEEVIDRFWYYSFGLEKSLAEGYVDRPQPLSAALAALMRSEVWGRAAQKLRCLRAIARAAIDEERRFVLVNLVETYLQLEGREAERYTEMIAREGNEEVGEMELTWAAKMRQEGVERGLELGRREGFEEGRVQEAQELLLRLLDKRFGPLPSSAVEKVEAMEDLQELRRLTEQLLQAGSLADLGLD